MTEIRSQKVDLSECRSLGSNQHQSGRSAKISIGITVEKSPRTPTVVSGFRKENAPVLQSPEKQSSYKGRLKSRSHGVVNLVTSKVELEEQKSSECLQSNSPSHKTSNTDTEKYYVNRVSVSTHKNVDGLDCKLNGEKDEGAYVDQELTFAAMQKVNLLNHEISKQPSREVDKSTTDGLKMKLWEILGGVPSQKEHSMNSLKYDENKENFGVDHNRGLRKDKVGRPKHCSDPIETDSESPNQTVRRPSTRSMTRKLCPKKLVTSLDDALNSGKKPLSSTCSDYKHKSEEKLRGHGTEKKISSFRREENRRIQNEKEYAKCNAHIELKTINRSSADNKPNVQANFKGNDREDIYSFSEVVPGNKRASKKSTNTRSKSSNKKKNATVEMKAINPPSRSSSKSALQKDEKEKIFLSPVKVPQCIETSSWLHYRSKKLTLQPKSVPNDSQNSQMDQQNLFNLPSMPKVAAYETLQSSLLKNEKGSWEYMDSSPMAKFTFQCNKTACSPVTSTADASDDLQSPTFAATPSTTSRPTNETAHSPLQRRSINFTWNFHNSDVMDNNKTGSYCSESNAESFDETNVDESHGLESAFEVGREIRKQMSLSPIAKHDSDSFGAKELKFKEFRGRNKWLPSVDNSVKSPLKPHKKRVHGLKDAKLSERDDVNLSGDDVNELHEAPDQCIEDSLARAMNQLALALRRIKSKIQLHTNKKSCEILAAVAEKIKFQLKDVETQIQEDMGKFTAYSKTKRKRLESQLGDYQERIRLIHDKFKEEVKHHLLNCSSTLEEFEAQDVELKGTADRQKVLHRKLLLQIEEAMKDQLTEAETSIAVVRKEAKKKINNLKFALQEWLGEGENI